MKDKMKTLIQGSKVQHKTLEVAKCDYKTNKVRIRAICGTIISER